MFLMATEKATSPEQSVQVDVLANALAAAINQTKPPARITVANRVPRNPNNPTNRVRKMPFNFYMNFGQVEEPDLTDVEFDLLPKLVPGNYIPDARQGFLIEIVDVKRGGQRGMHIRWNNQTGDQRMEVMARAGGTLAQIFNTCIAEAAQQKLDRKARRLSEQD
jgi:hypothetical protein